MGNDNMLEIFTLKKGVAVEWTMATNFAKKELVQLYKNWLAKVWSA